MPTRWTTARIDSLAFAAYTLLGGLLSMLGWVLDVPRLQDWWNTGIGIKGNTTLCLSLLGLALVIHQWQGRASLLTIGLAALPGAIGFATLLQHVFPVEFGIDTLLFHELPGAPATAAPGRMGPPAASSFALLAFSYLLIARGSRNVLSVALPLAVLVISTLSMIGYAYGAEAMYTVPRLTGISMQTATMLASLACAFVAAQPSRQPMRTMLEDSTAGDLARRIVPVAIGLPLLLGWLRIAGERSGYFDAAFGTALRTSVEIILLVGMLMWTTHVVRARDRQSRATEEAKRRGEQRVQRIVDSSALPFMVLAPVCDSAGVIVDFRWTYLNTAAATAFGRERHALIGRRVGDAFPDTWNEPGLFEQFTATAMRHEVRDFEVRSFAGGLKGWFQVIASSLDEEIAVWFSDITERKRHEQELRTADQRKDEFLATLAHELRNPLAPIRTATALARRPTVSAEQQRWCHDVIERQVQHMSLLLDDLLDVSRITRGKLELRRAPTSLKTLIESALETSRPLIDARNHCLDLQLPPDVLVNVDPLRIAQAVSNLLNNAAKYTPASGAIRLHTLVRGDDLAIEVSDNGIGIATEDLDTIFSMFGQVKTALERSEGGLGIGLALTRGLVELHGGRLDARSAGANQGSTFIITLPGVKMEAAMSFVPVTRGAGRASALRILVADDNPDAADSLAILLRSEGHEVITAADGEEALATFRRIKPQVALLDLGMPRMSGFDVALRIRELTSGVLLVAITGWGQAEDRARAEAAGFDHHFTKPLDFDTLATLLAGFAASK